MKIRIDLKILIFILIFYFTNQITIYLTVMFFCVLHELGHIFVGLILKMKPAKLEIMPFGVSVFFKANPKDRDIIIKNGSLLELKNIIVACGGPIVSLALAIFISRQDMIYPNILILLFNLLPIYPLDGGRIVKGILHINLGSVKTENIISKVSEITMIILTIISSILVYYLKNVAIFLFCIFLWCIILQEKNTKALDILQGK